MDYLNGYNMSVKNVCDHQHGKYGVYNQLPTHCKFFSLHFDKNLFSKASMRMIYSMMLDFILFIFSISKSSIKVLIATKFITVIGIVMEATIPSFPYVHLIVDFAVSCLIDIQCSTWIIMMLLFNIINVCVFTSLCKFLSIGREFISWLAHNQ